MKVNEKSLLWAWISNKINNHSYHNNTNIYLCTSYAPYVGEWVEYTKMACNSNLYTI